MTSDTLHLVLKHKWFDAIDRGEKTVEYRDNTPYYLIRIQNVYNAAIDLNTKPKVCFHKGYTKTTMTFHINRVNVTLVTDQIEIYLGDRIHDSN